MPGAVKVLIDGPSELIFDYALPEGVSARPGCRVKVPLRNTSATGTILDIGSTQSSAFKLKPVTSLIDPEPVVTEKLIQLARWMAGYYGTPLEQIMRSMLPGAVRQETHSAKTHLVATLVEMPDPEALDKLSRRAPRQHTILSLLEKSGPISLNDLGGASVRGSVKSLEDAGYLSVQPHEIRRDPDAGDVFLESTPHKLNLGQRYAYEEICASVDSFLDPDLDPEATSNFPKPILLHGVTGSGKTEVYLQAAQHCLDRGKSVLVLVPEIALTPQTVQHFKSRFSALHDQVAVLHSNLSQGERFDEWHRIRKGEAMVVVGARSAVFAPLPSPGLIIVDEEHENTYKQENPPKYQGRDLAVVRGNLERCQVVLGSATPSLESFQNAQSGKYNLVRLTERADGQSLPLIRVVDMRNETRKQKGGPAILSERLRTDMEKKLEAGQQVILFLNRRGFARSLQCPSCGHVCECQHCAVPLTYHRTEERLICHLCGYQSIVPRACPKCHDRSILLQGYGTQKVEEVLKKVFPSARLARLDADTARKKNALRNTLRDFRARKIDILLGTQMIAKGLDFPNVTLAGILNADLSLHAPDFRAGERTFQLLTQVAGRSGRGEMEGEVIIQTFTPHSPSVQFARHHDYEGFADQEYDFRQQFNFPPFTHAALLTSKCSHERLAEFTLQNLHQRLSTNLPGGIEMGAPNPAPTPRSHGLFRFQLLIRSDNPRVLSRHVQQVLSATTLPEEVSLVFDMDAYDFG
ncbi:MAG TPA: primosomal protein N' [Verrucomicrobiales bacterium]|nr:primosomal protein N' [Verrucomicrobiales bacterium]